MTPKWALERALADAEFALSQARIRRQAAKCRWQTANAEVAIYEKHLAELRRQPETERIEQ